MDSPADTLVCVKVSKVRDPAIDEDAPGAFEAIARYVRARSAEALAALPMKAGVRPRRWHLRALTADEHAFAVAQATEFEQQRTAFLLACHRVEHADGTAEEAHPVKTPAGYLLAPTPWYERCYRLAGASVIREMGGLALQRAELGEADAGPFVLSRGCAL